MRNPDLLKVLNESEVQELEKFANNETLLQAVKKCLLFDVYYNGVMEAGMPVNAGRNFLLSLVGSPGREAVPTEKIGHDMEVAWQAINIVEGGFKDLENFRTVVESPYEEVNEAR